MRIDSRWASGRIVIHCDSTISSKYSSCSESALVMNPRPFCPAFLVIMREEAGKQRAKDKLANHETVEEEQKTSKEPSKAQKWEIFRLHTQKLSLDKDVSFDEFIYQENDFSVADIKAICHEAGLVARRDFRMRVQMADFRAAREMVKTKNEHKSAGVLQTGLYLYLFKD
jgi:hypothetical protein